MGLQAPKIIRTGKRYCYLVRIFLRISYILVQLFISFGASSPIFYFTNKEGKSFLLCRFFIGNILQQVAGLTIQSLA